MKYLYFQSFFIFLLFSCSSSKKAVAPESLPKAEVEFLDTVEFVSAPAIQEEMSYDLEQYNASFTRRTDLLHTKLDLSFNWENQHVLGKATLTCSPLFYATDELTLDAKNFDIHRIILQENEEALHYEYDGLKLHITLDKEYQNNQEYTILIEYTAKPNEGKVGGSQAISSEKGLFFINPLGEQKDKPQQIWTQGETENNSRWFPTIDKPNERCTQEMILTVDDQFQTLSNGIKVSSNKNEDGTRTDYWKMNKAHAPYLFMIAVGPFSITYDQWNGKEVSYYVEPEYEADAKYIFNHTPEMLTFFSEYVGMEYPWDKYAQVVVRDYVSGAMENTTGVIFGEFVQKHKEELEFSNNDLIVAHEMFHHWFGDLVTCESWANLTMNEGFANYGEYLWFEHKYGSYYAENHRLNEMYGYFQEARTGAHPLIHFGYEDKEHMFDAHSYNKGGLVLHMLRSYVGDEAFRTGLNRYLTDNAYTAVEVHNLRLAFEAVCGEDLNWFFNQWFLEQGHPVLEVEKTFDPVQKKVLISVEQTQDPEKNPPIFQLPIDLDIYYSGGKKERKRIWIDDRKEFFEFDVVEDVVFVNFDPNKSTLCELNYSLSDKESIFQYYNGNSFRDKIDALAALRSSKLSESNAVFLDALNSKSEFLINAVLNSNKINTIPEAITIVAKYAKGDTPFKNIQRRALGLLGNLGDQSHVLVLENVLNNSTSAPLQAAALSSIQKLDSEKALIYAEKLANGSSKKLLSTLATIFADSGDKKYLPFFQDNISKVNGYEALPFFNSYKKILITLGPDEQLAQLESLLGFATNMSNSPWIRMSATRTLIDLRNELASKAKRENVDLSSHIEALTKALNEILEKEENEQLLNIYQSFISKS